MNKTEQKQELSNLIKTLSITKDLVEYNKTLSIIKVKLHAIPFNVGLQDIWETSVNSWIEDLEELSANFEMNDQRKFDLQQAYLAYGGLINLVDLSELPD